MKARACLVLAVGLGSVLQGALPGQSCLADALFGTRERDPAIPSPAAFLGRPAGRAPTTSEEAARYAGEVARKSARVRVETMGRSWGQRPLLKVTVSSPANLAAREEHRRRNRAFVEGRDEAPHSLPLTVWFVMSIHGNEASGVDAGLVLLHHLASDRSPETLSLLERVVLVLALNANPDGRDRFVTGVRDRSGGSVQVDPRAWEHHEPWPGGRTNRYLFDMNRDWFLQTQVETRVLVGEMLREWPHVVADFHEMGSGSTYFVSTPPGPPVNAHIGPSVRAGWKRIGRGIARAFDTRGWPYWQGDIYPADYPGYGGAWPCFLGAVGMTFEQAGSRGGSVRRRDGSILTYRESVERHAAAGFAALETAARERERLLEAFVRHFERLRREGQQDELPFFILTPRFDPDRLALLKATLDRNGIRTQVLVEGATLEAAPLRGGPVAPRSVPAGSVLVSSRQPLRPLVLALLDPRVDVDRGFLEAEARRLARRERSEVYDVSAWNLPLLFGVETFRAPPPGAGVQLADAVPAPPERGGPAETGAVAWLAPGRQLGSSALLARLVAAGVRVRVAPFPFAVEDRSFGRGTLVVLADRNREADLRRALERELARDDTPLRPVGTFRTAQGHDLGSSRTCPVRRPRIVVAAGPGVSPYSFGAVRWLFDQAVPTEHLCVALDGGLARALEEANVLVLPDGKGFGKHVGKDPLAAFLARGGTVVAFRGAVEFLAGKPVELLPLKTRKDTDDLGRAAGAIVAARLDPTHWLGHGLPQDVAVQVRTRRYWAPVDRKAAHTVVRFEKGAGLHLSGILPKEKKKALAGGPVVLEKVHGRGRIVAFTEDPVFRGTSPGLWKLVLNACLLGPSQDR